MFIPSDLAVKENASSLITAYERNIQRMEEGYKLLSQSEEEIDRVFGTTQRIGKFYSSYERDLAKARKDFRVKAWRSIVRNLGLPKVMSIKRQKEFDGNCKKGSLPEINTKNVHEFLDSIIGSMNEIVEETIQEVYEWLRPGARRYVEHKTNLKNARWRLGEKIIITSVATGHSWSKSYSLHYWCEDHFIQLDRAFHLLDGAGIPDGYKSPLVDAINTTAYVSGATGETEYFSFRCFYNGNIHITFKRLDLVKRLNAGAGGGKILGDG